MRRKDVDAGEIVRLYVEEGVRAPALAARFGCSTGVIYQRLDEAGVARSRVARLAPDEVARLYVDELLSAEQVAERFGVTRGPVIRLLREVGVPLRGDADEVIGRRPCPNSVVYRGYTLGFATGDLYVRALGSNRTTIDAACNTTQPAQRALIRDLFGAYGYVRTSGLTTRASLDGSFGFLLEKYERRVPAWVKASEEAAAAYIAGYVDAEGSFGVYEGRARFKVDAYDDWVLHWMAEWCATVGVSARLRRLGLRGDPRTDGTTLNDDLWRVNVNAGPSLLRFIATLDPFARHADRRAAMERARSNVLERLRRSARHLTNPVHLHAQPC